MRWRAAAGRSFARLIASAGASALVAGCFPGLPDEDVDDVDDVVDGGARADLGDATASPGADAVGPDVTAPGDARDSGDAGPSGSRALRVHVGVSPLRGPAGRVTFGAFPPPRGAVRWGVD